MQNYELSCYGMLCSRMTLTTTDPSMDTGDNMYGGCEGPDAM